jgi:hypothetical protein
MRITTQISFAVMVPLVLLSVRQAAHIGHVDAVSLARAATSRIAHAEHFGFDRWAPSPPPREDVTEEGVTDLYGNEITDAVARYRLDAEGSLYEQHSPRTELPRLGPPKS